MTTLNLSELARPLDAVRFPNGRECAARPFGAAQWETLTRAQQAEPAEALAIMQELLRWGVPDATEADWATLDEEGVMAAAIVGHCARKTEFVKQQLAALFPPDEPEDGEGNGGSGTRGPRSSRASRKPRRSATALRAPTGATSGPSGPTRST